MLFDITNVKKEDAERLLLNIVSRQDHSFGNILAIIDTGSPRTIISAKDVISLKIPVAGLENAKPINGFGRGSVPCKKLNKFKFYIKSKENKIKSIEMPVYAVDVSTLSSLNKDMVENIYRIPSIIGLDFLEKNNLKMIVNFKDNKSYFEEIQDENTSEKNS